LYSCESSTIEKSKLDFVNEEIRKGVTLAIKMRNGGFAEKNN